jgi:hypothetical protein
MPNLVGLPNAEKAIIETEKLQGYILSLSHPVGRFKAVVFQKLGYSAENWETFERSLRELILTQDALPVEESQYGKKFLVEGPFVGPSGRKIRIVTVWVILKDESLPKFVTAYPGGSL